MQPIREQYSLCMWCNMINCTETPLPKNQCCDVVVKVEPNVVHQSWFSETWASRGSPWRRMRTWQPAVRAQSRSLYWRGPIDQFLSDGWRSTRCGLPALPLHCRDPDLKECLTQRSYFEISKIHTVGWCLLSAAKAFYGYFSLLLKLWWGASFIKGQTLMGEWMLFAKQQPKQSLLCLLAFIYPHPVSSRSSEMMNNSVRSEGDKQTRCWSFETWPCLLTSDDWDELRSSSSHSSSGESITSDLPLDPEFKLH